MNGFHIAVSRTGRPANRPAAMAVRKFTLGLLVACTLMAPSSAALAFTAHTAVAAQADSHTLKVCDQGNLCI